ncbi:DUF2809 domain-containing protein [Dysgonomonas sp. 25]|uniref:ribosomal maturation YjgA family protein n=1 Tax=Dysgonomonas sp. 25 TaxID=2302933 RepID=UPI0013D1E735|nr:DUF2809 domain-containing protein [Dysgonomonas sp. 25]NDV69740.1 DUF2809 domain-containing protein [Dysgonomonas sp. 25]
MKNTANNPLFRFRFSIRSFIVFVLLFLVEVLIALFVNDSFVRPYGGDIIVVILIYYFLKTFIQTKSLYLIIPTLLFAYAVEIAQYFRMVEALGVQDNAILRTVLGSSFSWGDILCYTIGAFICYLIDGRKLYGTTDTKR